MEWPKRKSGVEWSGPSGRFQQQTILRLDFLSKVAYLLRGRTSGNWLWRFVFFFFFGCIWITVPRKINQCSVISRSVVGRLGYRRSTTRLTSRPVHHRLPNRCFSRSDTIRYSFSMTFWVDPSFFSRLSEPTPSPPSLVFVDAILRVSASSYSFH